MRWRRTVPSYEPGPPDPWDLQVVALLQQRDGLLSIVDLAGGASLRVWNIAWGYDAGDSFAHVTTNVSPDAPAEGGFDFFSTQDVIAVRTATPDSRALLLHPSRS